MMTTVNLNSEYVHAAADAMNITDAGFQYVSENEDATLDINIQVAAIVAAAGAALAKCGVKPNEIKLYINAAIHSRWCHISASSTAAMKAIYNSFHAA